MISEVAQEPDSPIALAEPPPDRIFDDAYWDYGLILAWIIYRDSTIAASFSEQAPRALGNVLIETVAGAKPAKRSLLKHLKDGSQRAVSLDLLRGTATKIKAREWPAVRVFFDDAGLAYRAPAAAITGRHNRLLRFKKSDATNLWPPTPATVREEAIIAPADPVLPAKKRSRARYALDPALKAIKALGSKRLLQMSAKAREKEIVDWCAEQEFHRPRPRSISRAFGELAKPPRRRVTR